MYQILKLKSYITVIKIPISDLEKIEVIMGKQPKEKIQDCFKRLIKKPDFIINGGLFNMSNGNTITTTVDEGQLVKDGYGSHFGLKVFKDLSFKFEAFKKGEDIKDYIGASPSLIINGRIDIQKPLDNNFMNVRHPRLALGSNDEFFFLVTVDGRTSTAKGMSIKELAEFMLSIGCKNAINEDGGGSLHLGQNIEGQLKILNTPTEDRAVDNFIGIYFKKPKENLIKQDEQFIVMTPIEFVKWLFKQNIKRKITTIQEHHTYSPGYTHFQKKPDEIYWMKVMKRCHTLVKKWKDIAQHFSTFPNGMICVGRNLELNPAGIFNHNTGSICIENIGAFDSEIMTEAQKNAIIIITAALCVKFNINPDINTILYHNWFDLNTGERTNGLKGIIKTCPGTKFFGGNSTKACESNFIPLVKSKIHDIKNPKVKMKVVASSLNVRSAPNVLSKVLGKLPKDTVIEINRITNNFAEFDFNNIKGFVSTKYLVDIK
jgi:hypothetical protein